MNAHVFVAYLGNLTNGLDDLGSAMRQAIKEKDPGPFGSDHVLAGNPISAPVRDNYRDSVGTNHPDTTT